MLSWPRADSANRHADEAIARDESGLPRIDAVLRVVAENDEHALRYPGQASRRSRAEADRGRAVTGGRDGLAGNRRHPLDDQVAVRVSPARGRGAVTGRTASLDHHYLPAMNLAQMRAPHQQAVARRQGRLHAGTGHRDDQEPAPACRDQPAAPNEHASRCGPGR